MTKVDIDPDSLHEGAEQLDAAKESVLAVSDGFQASIESYADAFGGDEIGMLLGIAHQACAEAALECLSTNIAELEVYAASLHDMADRYQKAEDDILAVFSKFEVPSARI